MTRRARALVVLVVLAGLAALARAVAVQAEWTGEAVLAAAVVALGVVAADRFTLELPHGLETEHFSLADAVWSTAILLAPPGAPTVGAVAGTVIWQLARRWPLRKLAFNAGQVALGLAAAEGVMALPGHRLAPDDPAAWGLAAVAMAVCALVNAGLVAGVIALLGHEPFLRVLVGPWRLTLAQWLGNVSVGILAAVAWHASPFGVALLAIPLGLLALAYRAWLESSIERDQMEQMMAAADVIARGDGLGDRLPVGDVEARLPRLALALNGMLERIEDAFRRERQTMLRVARELDAPVRTARAELLAMPDAATPADVAATRAAAGAALERALRILGDVDVVARGGTPGLVLPRDIAAGRIVDDVLAQAGPLLGDRLHADAVPATRLRGDRQRLAQALLVLLENAAVHAGDGAPVALRVIEEGEALRFEVADTGVGVPPGEEEAIFAPFYRAGAHPTGSGLGLAVVRAVAEAHGGRAGVQNRPGAGATFWLRVPR